MFKFWSSRHFLGTQSVLSLFEDFSKLFALDAKDSEDSLEHCLGDVLLLQEAFQRIYIINVAYLFAIHIVEFLCHGIAKPVALSLR